MLCSIQLTHDTTGPMLSKHANGFHTFASVLDNTSFVELRPKDAFVVTFEARFGMFFEDKDYQWKDLIRSGVVQAGVRCDQQVYDPLPPGGVEERKYAIALSSIRSTNMARLSMAP